MNSSAATTLQQHFGLPIDPFVPGALPEFFFVGGQRRFLAQRVVHALYFSGGVVILSGARGAGKTKVLDQVVAELRELSDSCRIDASVMMDAAEIRRLVAGSLGLSAAVAQSSAALIAAFAQWQPAGREPQPIVLIIDDAQLLAIPVLAECLVLARSAGGRLRLLLAGEPELMLAWQQSDAGAAELIELPPLDRQECADYVLTRLQAAGYRAASPLTESQWRELYEQSRGNIGAIHSVLPSLLEQKQTAASPRFPAVAAALQRLPLPYMGLGAALLAIIVVPMFFYSADKNAANKPASPGAPQPAGKSTEQRSVAIALPVVAVPPAQIKTETPLTSGGEQTAAIEKPAAAPAPAITQQPSPQSTQLAVPRPAQQTVLQSAPQSGASSIKPAVAAPQAAVAQPTNSVDAANKPVIDVKPSEPSPAAAAKAGAATERELSADENELLAGPPEQIMLQLLGAESPASAAKFIAERGNGLKLYAYRTRHKDRPWNIVVIGPYADRNAALAAVAKLPPALSAQKPWPRTLGSIQAEIRARR